MIEVKTLAALTMTPNARAQKFQSDVEKRVRDLDSKYPGSTFTQRLKSYGKDGKYLVLVVGPFANLSEDSMFLCDFHGCVRALRTTLAINRPCKLAYFGSLALARLILGHFHDDVLPESQALSGSGAFFDACTT